MLNLFAVNRTQKWHKFTISRPKSVFQIKSYGIPSSSMYNKLLDNTRCLNTLINFFIKMYIDCSDMGDIEESLFVDCWLH